MQRPVALAFRSCRHATHGGRGRRLGQDDFSSVVGTVSDAKPETDQIRILSTLDLLSSSASRRFRLLRHDFRGNSKGHAPNASRELSKLDGIEFYSN